MKRIYIAGPMTGKPDLNRAEFQKAWRSLNDQSVGPIDIINPHYIGFFRKWTDGTDVRAIAKELLNHLLICDSIYMLRGWKESKGATAEHAVAKWIGLEIIYQEGAE